MGLDMFLQKAKEDDNGNTILTEVLYWRKAYAIMDWFSTKINKRYYTEEIIHNCAMYSFSKEEIKELIDWCKDFKTEPSTAMGKIKPHWYEERWENYEKEECEITIKDLEEILQDPDIKYFIFHAWW